MDEEGQIWRLVMSGKVTLHQLETSLSYDDMLRLLAVLDINEAITEALTPTPPTGK